MPFDPRDRLIPGNLDCDAALNAANSEKRNRVFKAIDNLSRVELDGQVINGLRGLVGVTRSLGAQDVFDSIDVNPRVMNALSSFRPTVANNALAAANSIVARGVPSKLRDFPNFIANSTGDVASLGDAKREVLRMLAPEDSNVDDDSPRPCLAKPYANDLVKLAQKNSFSFVVEFIPAPSYVNLLPNNFSALVSKFNRPTLKFEWEELNFYNFRSKVRKKVMHDPITLEFLDDSNGIVLSTLINYLKIISPLHKDVNHKQLENEGLNFRTTGPDFSASSRNLAKANDKLVFSDIFLYHIHSYGAQVDTYQFVHPKILDINLSDLDMATSEISNISMQFDYDTVIVTPNMSSSTNPGLTERIKRASSLGREYDIALGTTGAVDGSSDSDIEESESLDGFFSNPDDEFDIVNDTQNNEDFIDNALFGFFDDS